MSINWSLKNAFSRLSFFLLSNVLLPKMDIATMSHSLEGRSPFSVNIF